MRVDFEQSGGFANITYRFNADLDELPDEEATRIRELIEASGVFEGGLPVPDAQPAGLTYRLRVSDGPRIGAWQGTDSTLPEPLAPLIDALNELAIEAKKRGG